MIFSLLSVVGGTMLVAMTMANPVPQQQNYPLRLVHQFPNNTWIENMAIRRNGQILGTNTDGGNVFLVDPFQPSDVTPPVIASFDNTTALTGIAEVEDDVFYVQGIRNSSALRFQFPANASSVWRIDMRCYAQTGRADVSKVADIPQIGLPNGMILLSKSAGTVLIADSAEGRIWRFNVRTGHYEVVIDEPVLKPITGSIPAFGVNGVKVVGSTLYFSNFNQALLGTFKITPDGRSCSEPTIISNKVNDADDFDVAKDGSIWLTENIKNTVVHVFPDGQVVTVAGGANSSQVYGPVSARFGRTKKDQKILYISTNGLSYNSAGVQQTTNGKIVALDTSK